jgi:tetratricopeptide (TPR) repeat protein
MAAELDRARALIDLGRHQAALELLVADAAGLSDQTEFWNLQAQAALAIGRPADAVGFTERSLALDPNQGWAHRLRAIAYGQVGDPRALEAAEEAVRQDPHQAYAHVCLANALLTKYVRGPSRLAGYGERALQSAERAVELAPGDAQCHLCLAQVHARRGSRDAARAAAAEALALAPHDADIHNDVALVNQVLGAEHHALEGFARAAALAPAHSVAGSNFDLSARRAWDRAVWVMCLGFVVAGVFLKSSDHPTGGARRGVSGLTLALMLAALLYALRATRGLSESQRHRAQRLIAGGGRRGQIFLGGIGMTIVCLIFAIALPSSAGRVALIVACAVFLLGLIAGRVPVDKAAIPQHRFQRTRPRSRP